MDNTNTAITADDDIPFGTAYGADEPAAELTLGAGAGHISELVLPDDVRRLQVTLRREDDGSLRIGVYGRREDYRSHDMWVLREWQVR